MKQGTYGFSVYGVTVAFTAPETLMALVNRSDISKLALEVRHRLERVSDQVTLRTFRAA